jgi:VanZ family protein
MAGWPSLSTRSTRPPKPVANTTMLRPASRAGRGALIAYVLVIVYASLNPFYGWRTPEVIGVFTWPKYVTVFDVLLNALAYLPLGAFSAAMWRFSARRRFLSRPVPRYVNWQAWAVSVALGAMLSVVMELLQAWLPNRVSSPIDWLMNTGGAMLGASAVLLAPGRALLAEVEKWRHRHFAYGTETEWGLLLLALWLFAQMNPAIPFFEAGTVVRAGPGEEMPHPYDPLFLLPQAVAIAFNTCGFALFLSLLLHPAKRVWANALFIIALGFVVKVSMAALMLKAPQLIAWIGPGTVIGLGAGLLISTLLMGCTFRWRAFFATLLVFAGGLMAKVSGVYGSATETLRLFDWPYGQLVNFASLTRWVHEVWPLLALIFLAIVFVKHRLEH